MLGLNTPGQRDGQVRACLCLFMCMCAPVHVCDFVSMFAFVSVLPSLCERKREREGEF